MNTLQKFILGIVAVATVVIGVHAYAHKGLGDATVSNYPTWYYGGIVIGPSNDLLSNVISGKCSAIGQVSLANGSSEAITCTLPGATVGDQLTVQAENSQTTSTTGGFPIVDATVSAASTVTMHIVNNSGSTQTPAVGTIDYIDFR